MGSRIYSMSRVHFFEKGELEGFLTTCARTLKASAFHKRHQSPAVVLPRLVAVPNSG